MNALLKKRNTVYGICALWIVFFHIFRHISMPYIPVVTNIIAVGNFAVDIFFFLSGVCLSLSAGKHGYSGTGWLDFYKRRCIRVLLPYLIICVPFYLWSAVCESSGSALRKAAAFLSNLSSASFWIKGHQTTWFVFGILVFYLLFPLLYTFISKAPAKNGAAVMAAAVLLAVLSAYVPVVKNSMILWARLPVFVSGIIAGISGRELRPKPVHFVISAAVLVSLGTLTSLSELSGAFTIPQVCRLLIYLPMTLAAAVLLSFEGGKLPPLERIGELSLEIYLIHIILFHPLKYYGLLDSLGGWLYLILPVISVVAALAVDLIKKAILNRNKEQGV